MLFVKLSWDHSSRVDSSKLSGSRENDLEGVSIFPSFRILGLFPERVQAAETALLLKIIIGIVFYSCVVSSRGTSLSRGPSDWMTGDGIPMCSNVLIMVAEL